MKRIVLICGLIAGLVVSIIMSISMITCYNNPDYKVGNSAMIVGYLSMLVGVFNYLCGRKKLQG
jgi:riboflavin transporter FmnP